MGSAQGSRQRLRCIQEGGWILRTGLDSQTNAQSSDGPWSRGTPEPTAGQMDSVLLLSVAVTQLEGWSPVKMCHPDVTEPTCKGKTEATGRGLGSDSGVSNVCLCHQAQRLLLQTQTDDYKRLLRPTPVPPTKAAPIQNRKLRTQPACDVSLTLPPAPLLKQPRTLLPDSLRAKAAGLTPALGPSPAFRT